MKEEEEEEGGKGKAGKGREATRSKVIEKER